MATLNLKDAPHTYSTMVSLLKAMERAEVETSTCRPPPKSSVAA